MPFCQFDILVRVTLYIFQDADIAAGAVTVTPRRKEVVDFTQPFMTFKSTALIKKPKKRKSRIKSVRSLLQSSSNYGVIQNSVTQDSFSHSGDPIYQRMWARMATFWPPAFVQSIQEGVERVRREKYAFILDAPTAEYIASRQPCEFYTLEPFLEVRQYAFAMRKGDEIVTSLNVALQRILDTREMQQMYLKWWRGECHQRNRATMRPRKVRTDTESIVTRDPDPWGYATASILTGHSDSCTRLPYHTSILISICISMYIYMYNH